MQKHSSILKRISLTNCILLILLFIGCTPLNEPEDDYSFAIYFLKNDDLKIGDILDKNINKIKVQSEPWLTNNDIDFYDWSSHCIYLKETLSDFIPGWDTTLRILKRFPREWADKPFLVTSKGQRKYLGYIFSFLYSNTLVPIPMFDDGYLSIGPAKILKFDWLWLYINNPLNNSDIKEALIEENKCFHGIMVYLDSLSQNTIYVVDNADTATISYTLTISNESEENIYVLDPQKTGSDIFHYYNQGIVFTSIDDSSEYKSWYKNRYTPPESGYINWDWFTKIESYETIEREISLKGYPCLKKGRYKVQCDFNSPINFKQEELITTDGRYWYGTILSNTYTWEYK
jgi:hypothetical protein